MKKFLALTAIVLTAATAKADTKSITGVRVNNKAEANFTENYKGATGLWNVEDSYVEVMFFWKNELMDSFYDNDGNLIGTFHEIEVDQLPEKTKAKIAAWYKGYHILSATLMQRDDEDDVTYVKIVSDKHARVLQVDQNGVISEFKIIR